MKRRFRLSGRSDFQRLLSGRRLYAGATLVGFATPGRNRARRRLREAARRTLLGDGSRAARSGISFDVVLIARPPALTAPFSDLETDLGELAARLANSN